MTTKFVQISNNGLNYILNVNIFLHPNRKEVIDRHSAGQ